MSGVAVAILMLILMGAIVGASLTIGAPYLAIPLVLVVLFVWGGVRVATAREGRSGIGEEDVSDEDVEFTDEDRRTLTPPSATPPGRPGSEAAR